MRQLPVDRPGPWRRAPAIALIVIAAAFRTPDPGSDAIRAMVREAEDLAYFEAFVPARAKLERALQVAERRRDAGLIALCLDRIGSVLDFEGHVAAGAERHQRALARAREMGDRSLAASILASIGLAHWRQAQYDAALGVLHDALATQDELGDDPGRARTLVFIGRVHFKRADYALATDAHRRAVTILKAGDDRRWLSIALEDLGDVALEQGYFVEAVDAFEQALAARREAGDLPGEIYMLNIVGRAYLVQGAYREALAWFERAVALSEEIGDRPSRALALYHMGIAHDELADPDRALALYARALALKQELGDRRQQAWILRHIGDAHAARGDLLSALDAHSRAMGIWQQIGDTRGLATGLTRAAVIRFDLGHYDTSAELFGRAAALAGTSQPASLATALAGMGKAYAAGGDAVRALEHGGRAAVLARGSPDVARWRTFQSLGWIERRLGRGKEALARYRESLAIIETLRGRVVPSSDVRARFLEGKQAVYAETIEVLMDLGRAAEALEVAERARTRAFLDLLFGRDLVTKPIDRAALVTTPSPTLDQARHEARRSGGTIVEYFSTTDRLYIWVVAADGRIRSAVSPISRRELSRLVGDVRAAMRDPGISRGTTAGAPGNAAPAARPLLRRLHGALIDPVRRLLPAQPDGIVTIVPHGPLFLLSFAALIDADGRYLVERHTLAYSPSISVLRYTQRNRDRAAHSGPRRLLVVGNPRMPPAADGGTPLAQLPDAEIEASAIEALYPPGRVTALTGSLARERTVRELAPAHAILHFATHAVVFDDEATSSYLALTADDRATSRAQNAEGDGFLTVAEVFGLDLHADLVTLSACNTGLGHISGEGVAGLSRAFLYAGTASVLVSLWRVADSVAATQMDRFYRTLIRTGGNKAVALAAAQREVIAMLREGRLHSPSGRALPEDPLLWAPFVLVGETR